MQSPNLEAINLYDSEVQLDFTKFEVRDFLSIQLNAFVETVEVNRGGTIHRRLKPETITDSITAEQQQDPNYCKVADLVCKEQTRTIRGEEITSMHLRYPGEKLRDLVLQGLYNKYKDQGLNELELLTKIDAELASDDLKSNTHLEHNAHNFIVESCRKVVARSIKTLTQLREYGITLRDGQLWIEELNSATIHINRDGGARAALTEDEIEHAQELITAVQRLYERKYQQPFTAVMNPELEPIVAEVDQSLRRSGMTGPLVAMIMLLLLTYMGWEAISNSMEDDKAPVPQYLAITDTTEEAIETDIVRSPERRDIDAETLTPKMTEQRDIDVAPTDLLDATESNTQTPSDSPSPLPTDTIEPTDTLMPTMTATDTATETATETDTTPTETESEVPTLRLPENTNSPAPTDVPSLTPTASFTPSNTPSTTPENTAVQTNTPESVVTLPRLPESTNTPLSATLTATPRQRDTDVAPSDIPTETTTSKPTIAPTETIEFVETAIPEGAVSEPRLPVVPTIPDIKIVQRHDIDVVARIDTQIPEVTISMQGAPDFGTALIWAMEEDHALSATINEYIWQIYSTATPEQRSRIDNKITKLFGWDFAGLSANDAKSQLAKLSNVQIMMTWLRTADVTNATQAKALRTLHTDSNITLSLADGLFEIEIQR